MSQCEVFVLCDDYEEAEIEYEAFITFLTSNDYTNFNYINAAACIVEINNTRYKFMGERWFPFIEKKLDMVRTIVLPITEFISIHYLDPNYYLNNYIGLPKFIRRRYDEYEDET